MKNRVFGAIDARRDDIIRIAETVMANPELGYKEYKTAALVKEKLTELGVGYRDGLALTGVKATVKGRCAGPNVAVIGELDAIRCFGHPDADPETGAAHACGHHAQIAILLGAAYGILESGVLDELDGSVTFFAVPAEEFAELEYREQLKKDGKIEFFGGKQELIRLGEFDDVDISMMLHSLAGDAEPTILLDGSSLGFTAKQITFKGRAVHASEPFEGVNALNAAMLALMGIAANRETFRDSDKIRIHPIITNGGELVNVVPSRTTIETYVRGARAEAIVDACRKVDAAVKGGAMAVGAECEIADTVGYLPLHQSHMLTEIFAENAKGLVGEEHLRYGIDMIGSTDMGDLSAKMPCIHPSMGGYKGSAHGVDFATVDPDAAYILPAKMLAATVCDLLRDGAKKAKAVTEDFKARKA
jgi:amidohydrolase